MAGDPSSVVVEGNVMQVLGMGKKIHEIIDRRSFVAATLPVLLLRWNEIKIAALQPFPDMELGTFCSITVNLWASVLNLMASRRLMIDTLVTLFRHSRPQGISPRVSEWLSSIDAIRASAVSRRGQYREAALFAMKSVYTELRNTIDYAASDFFDRLQTFNGVILISTAGLSIEAESLLVAIIVNWAYYSREGVDPDILKPLILVLDDCLSLIKGTSAMDAEGSSTNPLATFVHTGRSRKIGFVLSAQNYSVVSPSIANNCSTILAFGSYGEDASKLGRHLNLTREMKSVLPAIQPGEVIAIARTVHPTAVRGLVPDVK